jgi:hypothetical protein
MVPPPAAAFAHKAGPVQSLRVTLVPHATAVHTPLPLQQYKPPELCQLKAMIGPLIHLLHCPSIMAHVAGALSPHCALLHSRNSTRMTREQGHTF